MRFLTAVRALFGPVPRKYPKGNGIYCDGCDALLAVAVQQLAYNGGFYCRRCAEEIHGISQDRAAD